MKRTLESLDGAAIEGQRALVRVDFNCPIKDGVVTDNSRIRAALPTIRFLRARAPGRPALPSRSAEGPRSEIFVAAGARELEKLLGAPVTFLADPTSSEAATATRRLPRGSVALAENTRFFPGEEENDPDLAAQLRGAG